MSNENIIQIKPQDIDPLYASDVADHLITSVEQDMCAMDHAFTYASDLRGELINKLHYAVRDMDFKIDNKTDPEVANSKLRSIEVMSKLLCDTEKNAKDRVLTKFKKQEMDDVHEMSINVAEIVASLHEHDNTVSVIPADERIRQVDDLIANSGIELSPEELLVSNDVSDIAAEIRANMDDSHKNEL